MRAGHISLALAAVVSGTHIHDEDPNCPCVPGPVAESTTGCTEIRVPLGIGNTLYPEPFLPLASMCYPAAYGSSCSAWDEGLVPFCSRANAPSYCGSEWCYVDGERCRQGSNVPVSRSYLFPADEYGDVHYSYATCTYNISSPRGAWQSSPPSPALLAAANSVRAHTLTVGVPMSFGGVIFKRDPITRTILTGIGETYYDATVPWEGPLVDYYQELSRVFGVNFSFTTFNSGAFYGARTPDEFASAMVREVSEGAVDIGGFPARAHADLFAATPFTAPLIEDNYYLYVETARANPDWLTRAVYCLLPFSPELWLTCGVIVLIMGGLSTLLECSEPTLKPGVVIRGWGNGIYTSFIQLLTGFEAKEATEPSLRILYIGWAFFVCLCLAAYTANFAAFLVRTPKTTHFKFISEALEYDPDIRICYPMDGGVRTYILNHYPTIAYNLHGLPPGGLAETYDRAQCSALIWSEVAIPRYPNNLAFMCERKFSQQEWVTKVSIAQPVHDATVAAVLDYWMAELGNSGLTYANFEAAYQLTSVQEGCDVFASPYRTASTVREQRQAYFDNYHTTAFDATGQMVNRTPTADGPRRRLGSADPPPSRLPARRRQLRAAARGAAAGSASSD